MNIYIYSEVIKQEHKNVILDLLDQVQQEGAQLYVNSSFANQLIAHELPIGPYKLVDDYFAFMDAKIDYTITLGGDGTILNAVKIVRNSKVPIIGVNLGRLGFLSSVEKSKTPLILESINRGAIHTEQRTLLHLSSNIPMFEEAPFALNDFTLHKRDTSSMVTIHTYINGKFLNTYWSDGIIVCTPTGSTGYSLACGGPIVFPESGNFVITPIAPHNLNVRPLVISDNSELTIKIDGRSKNFMCTLDSRYETVTQHHVMTIKKCDFNIVLGTLEDINFMKTIRHKLMWGTDKRN